MQKSDFLLISKKILTSDVFELCFQSREKLEFLPGQFITFLLPKTWFRRAYSILENDGNIWKFIIKRLENGRWGSKELCDLELGIEIPWIWPVWHFVVSPEKNNKLFIATWTGMVPIFSMIQHLSEKNYSQKIGLLYGNTTQKDFYYKEEFRKLWEKLWSFENIFCLSREDISWFYSWRVTQNLAEDFIKKYDEFYICGNPYMVDEVREKLLFWWVWKEKIFFEKY